VAILGNNFLRNKVQTATDPYFSNVQLLLHGDGADGSTNIIDSSFNNRTVAANGNAQISTAQSKFTSSSIYFDGSGDFLSTPVDSGLTFGSNALTWEAWVYPQQSSPALPIIILSNARADAGGDFGCFLSYSNNEFRFRNWLANNGAYFTTSVTLNQWYYLAATKVGTTARIWVNDIEGTSGSLFSTNTSHTSFLVGAANNNGGFTVDYKGYMNEIRLTNGIARAITSVPTAPFPDN
jgi:hypothetical protein